MPTSASGDNAAREPERRNTNTMTMMAAAPPAALASNSSSATDAATDHMPNESTRTKRSLKHQSWEYAIRSGVAGGIAGCAAKTVVGPLDRVKILFQASNPQFQKYTGSWFGVVRAVRDIWTADGMRGLFRGHSATLLRIFPYAGIKFLAYEQVRAVMIRDHSQETSARRFASGSIAGMASVFFTYPLEVVRVRMAFETRSDKRTGYLDICRRIYSEKPSGGSTIISRQGGGAGVASTAAESASAVASTATAPSGLSNFFRGFTPTMWGMLPYAGSSFLAHDAAGDFMRQPRLAPYTTLPGTEGVDERGVKPAQLRYWAELATGGFAGFVSQTVSYPLEVVRRRMQVGGVVGDGHRLGMAEVARSIYAHSGWRGFYVGLTIGYVKVVPMVSVSFYAYERAKYWLGI